MEAGNLYVNRGITGAIVRRQPFGGWKRSVVGPTAKAGGPNYVNTLARWHDAGVDVDTVTTAYQRWMSDIGYHERDPSALSAERNAHRYRALSGGVLIRCGSNVADRERELLGAASRVTGRAHRLVRCRRRTRGPRCAHDSERSASTGSDSSATTPTQTATTSALLPMPRAFRSTDRASRWCSRDRATEVAARADGDHDDASPRPTPPLAASGSSACASPTRRRPLCVRAFRRPAATPRSRAAAPHGCRPRSSSGPGAA